MTIIYADEDTEFTEDEFTSPEKILPLVRMTSYCRNGQCCQCVSTRCHPCARCRHRPRPRLHANYDGTPSHNPLQYQGYDGTPSHKPQYQGDTQ